MKRLGFDMRIIIHYAFAAAVLSLYGGRVCYLVDTLNIMTWTKFLAVVFMGAYVVRSLLWRRFVENAPQSSRPRRAFLADIGIFIAISAFITAYNDSVYGFGIHSGLKVTAGVAAFGFFIAVDSALEVEKKLLGESAATGTELGGGDKIISLPLKFSIVGSITVLLIVLIVFLFFARDLLLIGEGPYDDYGMIIGRMSKELVFLAAVILIEVINMLISYSRSMRMQFQYHTGALLAVAEGDLAQKVPEATNDEFGLIGRYTNMMITTLRSRTAEKQTAEDAARLKDKFVSLVAHDLRSPFNSILGLLKIAAKDEQTPMPQKHRELVAKAISSSEMLVKTIDQLLDITMLQSGKIQVEPRYFKTRDLAQTTIDQHSSLAEQKGITLINALSQTQRVYGDPVLVGEIFTNLISNGIKFCKAGDSITIFSPEEEPSSVAVRDTGVGIPKELLPDIFKAEVKTSSQGTAGEKGTGLGLPFCSDIMRAHGGGISAKSEPGWGAVFTISFPPVKPAVLICLKEQAGRREVAEHVAMQGLLAVEAETPELAERIIVDSPPHLLVVEMDAEGFTGMELVAKMRGGTQNPKQRVLAVTNSDNLELKSAVLKLKVAGIADGRNGAEAILVKIFQVV